MSGYLYRARERLHPLNQLRRYAVSRAILSTIDSPIWVRLPGVQWKVRVRLVRHASFFILSGGAEPRIVALVHAMWPQFGIRSFWDVGATRGYYSWLIKSIAPGAKIRMFEADPDNMALVRETICRAGLRDITPREVAVSDGPGTRRFGRDEVSGATGCIQDVGTTYAQRQWGVTGSTVVVDTVSLDNESAAAGAVDLIKIDVEGHEEAVIIGALNVIRRDQPAVIFECFHGAGEIRNTLESLGYWVGDAERMADASMATSNFLALSQAASRAAS